MARIHGRFSSPDPLNDDSYLSPAKPQSQSRSRSKEITSSKKKINKRKTFELDVGNDISPQKIRVTVEAGNDEFEDVINLQSRPIYWQKKKIMACTQPSNNSSNLNSRNKLVSTPKQTRNRSIKPTGAASNKKSVTKGKKFPLKKATIEQDDVKNSSHGGGELDSDIGEPSSGRKGRSLSRSRKSKSIPQFRSPARCPNKITSSHNVISAPKNRDILEQGRYISLVYNTPQCTELSYNVSAYDDSDPEVVGRSNLQSQPLNEASVMGRPENHIEKNPKLRLFAKKNIDSQVAKNSNLYQGDNHGAKSKSDPTYYPSPDSPEKFLDRNHQKKSIDNSKFQSNQDSKLHNLEDGQELIESKHCYEYQESDTILESEEFSMISVDSVPSLIEHIKTSSHNCTSPRRNSNLVTQNDSQRSSIAIHKDEMTDQEVPQPPNSWSENISDLYQNSTQRPTNRTIDETPHRRGSYSTDLNQNFHQRDNSNQQLQLKTSISGSLPSEKEKENFSNISTSDIKSLMSTSLSQYDSSSKVLKTAPKIYSLSQSGESVKPSLCRLSTSKITSPLANGLAQDSENLVSSHKIPIQETSRGQIDSFPTHYQLCSSPIELKDCHHSSMSHQNDNRCTNKDIPNQKSRLSSSPSLSSHISKRCQSSHDRKLRGLKENVIITSLHSARESSSSPQSTHLDSNSLLSPFLSPSTNGESMLSCTVEKIQLPLQNNLESLSRNFNEGCKDIHSSWVSESLEKSTSINVDSRFILEAHQGQMNSLETCQELAPKAIERGNNHQNNNGTSQKSKEPSFIPELSKVSHLNNLTSCPNGNEEEDFDLLLETINSATPLASRQNGQSREPYQLPRTPKPQNFGWSSSKITASNDKFFGSSISDKKKLNQRSKFYQNNITQASSTSKRSENNFLERVNNFDYQIPQKSNFQPTVRKTKNSTDSSFFNVSPTRKLPALVSISNESFQPRNSNTNSYEIQSSSNDHNISPSRQESRSRSQSKMNSFSIEISQNTFSPRYRASSPVSSNITNKSSDIPSKPNDYNSSKFHDVYPSSSNQVIGNEKQKKNPPVQFSTFKNNLDRNPKSTPRKQKPPTIPTSSPTKSCLRSPLKSQMGRLASPRSPSKMVTFVSSSVTASPIYDPPSAVTWTRNHWLILDEIVQRWKIENDRESSPASEIYSMQNHRQKPLRNSTRVISQLLGKYVHSAEGERMKLEQWHLEVVDEFRGVVPGWDEKVIAMRLFALLVGERVRAERETSQKC